MTARSQCPDCNSGLRQPFTSCRCGWVEPKAARTSYSEAGPSLACDTPNCDQPAFTRDETGVWCQRCDEGRRNAAAFAHCKALGLTSVNDMKAFVRAKLRTVGRHAPNGAEWRENITQGTVDYLVRQHTDDCDKLLERLRGSCVIDEQSKVIPKDRRPAMRAERAAHIENERRKAEAELKRQRELLEARTPEASA